MIIFAQTPTTFRKPEYAMTGMRLKIFTDLELTDKIVDEVIQTTEYAHVMSLGAYNRLDTEHTYYAVTQIITTMGYTQNTPVVEFVPKLGDKARMVSFFPGKPAYTYIETGFDLMNHPRGLFTVTAVTDPDNTIQIANYTFVISMEMDGKYTPVAGATHITENKFLVEKILPKKSLYKVSVMAHGANGESSEWQHKYFNTSDNLLRIKTINKKVGEKLEFEVVDSDITVDSVTGTDSSDGLNETLKDITYLMIGHDSRGVQWFEYIKPII